MNPFEINLSAMTISLGREQRTIIPSKFKL